MPLRRKIVLIVVCIFLMMMGAIYTITRMILISGYTELEERDIIHGLRQLSHIIENEMDQIKSVALDWGPWDDTYEFVVNPHQAYIDNNLIAETFRNYRLSYSIYFDAEGRFVYGKAYDLEKQRPLPLPENLIHRLRDHPNLIRHQRTRDVTKGILMLPDQTVLVASAPILNSRFEGPIRGALIMGRILNQTEIRQIGEKAQLKVAVRRWDDPHLPVDFSSAKSALLGKNSAFIRRNGPNRISAYVMLRDVQGRPGLIAGIEKERDIFLQGRESLHYFILSLLAISLLFTLAAFVFLEKSVLSKLAYLSQTVRKIGLSRSFTSRIHLKGRDELADLARDINEMLEALRQSEERDKALLDNIEDGYFEVDLMGDFTFFNDSLCRITGYDREATVGMNFSRFTSPDTVDRLTTEFRLAFRSGKSIQAVEGELIRKDGEHRYLETSVSLIRDIGGKPIGFRGIVRDITERRRLEEQLKTQAATDPLTGVENRRRFLERSAVEFQRFQRYGGSFCAAILDIDHFKRINDSYGHAAGDDVLRNLAEKCKEILRQTDFFGRLGGEEFAFVFVGADMAVAEAIAERLRLAMESCFLTIDDREIRCTVSIGITEIRPADESFETVLKRADAALYEAKRQGRNRTVKD
ncbi:MAG: diguanylate cyclase [Thermodesulfobacteriota bacterium]